MTEQKKQFCVLKPERSLASALKFVYLLAFIMACYNFRYYFHLDSTKIPGLSQISDQDDFKDLVSYMYLALGIFVFLHHIRLYLTIELLEDPSSKLHQEIIMDLWALGPFSEQLVRMTIACFVGFKAFDVMMYDEGYFQWLMWPANTLFDYMRNDTFNLNLPESISIFSGNDKKSTISFLFYLVNIFLLLLIWDFIILFFSRSLKDYLITNLKNTNLKKIVALINKDSWEIIVEFQWKEAVFSKLILLINSKHFKLTVSHLVGVLMCMSYIYIIHTYEIESSNSDDQTQFYIMHHIRLFVFFTICLVLYCVSIFIDFKMNIKSYVEILTGTFKNIFVPYYGDSCIGKCFENNSEKSLEPLQPLSKSER